jgi:VWFA-related protein
MGILRCVAVAAIAAGSFPSQRGQATFRSGVGIVPVPVSVHDASGRLVTSLEQSDFEILEDGRAVPIALFTHEPQPLTLLLMLDTSTSASSSIQSVRRSALAVVDALGPADRVRIGTFGAEIAISPHLTGDRSVLTRIVREEIWPSFTSRVWDAAWRGLETLSGDSGSRRTLLLLTDGADTSPTGTRGSSTPRSVTDVHERARHDQWSIYAVVPRRSPDQGLRRLVDDTGGRMLVSSGNLPDTFAALMGELRQQYLLGFTSTTTDGRVHSIEVRTRRSGLRVTARRSYEAVSR